MPRKIKGWEFKERHKDAWEEYKALKFYKNMYKSSDVKILFMTNQYGQSYTDIYVKVGAKPVATMTAKFGSHMSFRRKKLCQQNHIIQEKVKR